VIIVDDRSTDGSYEYLLECKSEFPNLKSITVDSLPDHLDAKKYAITLGIKAALYDQILLTDADCKPISNKWISSLANSWNKKTSFVLGFSSYQKAPGLLNYFIRFETILTGIQYIASSALGYPYMGVGRNLSYSKNLFLSNKGFHGFQDLVGGDDDIFVNKYAKVTNSQVVITNESITSSIPKSNLSDFFIQKTRHLAIGKRYSSKSKIILGVFMLSWVLTWGLLPFEILSAQNLVLPGLILLGRYILMGTTFTIFANKSGAKINLLGIMLLDFMFVLYYFVTGIKALLIKRVKWS
jgi:glycosyl transferase family 2